MKPASATGYPSETAIVKDGNQELLRWQGTPVADSQYQSSATRVLIILEEDFLHTPCGQYDWDGPVYGTGGHCIRIYLPV